MLHTLQRRLHTRSSELIPFISLFLGAALLIAFAKLSSEVAEGDLGDMDRRILLALREAGDHAKALGPQWLQVAARDITSLGSPAVLTLITLLTLVYLALKKRPGSALLLIAAVGGGTLFSNLIKHLMARPRPDFVADVAQIHSYSFPSGHSLLSAVTFLTIGALLARVERQQRLKVFILVTAVLLTLVIGLSRVYIGVHWPTDVLAGWAFGAAWAMICWGCAAWLQSRDRLRDPTSFDQMPAQASQTRSFARGD